MRKSPKKGDAFAHMPTLALLHVAELRRTRTQAEIIQNRILQVRTYTSIKITPILQR